MMGKEFLEKLIRLEINYQKGLNYINNTNIESSLRPLYISRLKELRENIQSLIPKEEETTKKRGR